MSRCKCGREDAHYQTDAYEHGGALVEIHECKCGREGTLVRYPDGRTAGRGILAEQADEEIRTVAAEVRALGNRLKNFTRRKR